MFDNICTLPLSSDVFAQAIHPTQPIFSVGLASGHVQTFRLPPIGEAPQANGPTSSIRSTGRRLSETGFDTIDIVWQTRRHKGSCRALAFGTDGKTLYSAGTDGIVKVAETETGRATSKIAVPLYGSSKIDAPSVIAALSPQNLLLGTDTGKLHIYDLRSPTSDSGKPSRPSQTTRPHSRDDTSYAEPLTSLTPLPPTSASTSGTSRTWITTSGSSLAVSDLRKGVVTVSDDQGDVLLSSACVSGLGLSKKRRRLDEGGSGGFGEKILVGGAQGVLTLWDRGQWEDQTGRVVVHRGMAGDDDGTIEAIAAVPDASAGESKSGGRRTVVVGLGTGEINFVRLRGGGGDNFGSVRHDETGVDGVATLGFDVYGRLISGGGQILKVWHTKAVGGAETAEVEECGEEDDSDAAAGEEPDSDEADFDVSSEDDSDTQRRKNKKRKKGKGKSKGQSGTPGIAAFAGMD